MSVVNTNELLKKYINERNSTSAKNYLQLQKNILCNPVANYFDEYDATSLHKFFLENGLFFPDAKIEEDIKMLEKNQVWNLVEKYYKYLKNEWHGAKATIFIFPSETRNIMIMEELKGKMGVSFQNVIVLLLSKGVSKKELKALFAHEYNHVCRFAAIKKNFSELTLLDSMIIEGMAEVAVEKELGKDVLAPWVSLYTKNELLPYWKKASRFLHVKGKEKHDPVLYGDLTYRGFPKWFGYCMGYEIVKSYIDSNKEMTIANLIKKDSKDILLKSNF